MADKPEEESKQDLEGWFIGSEKAHDEELVTNPPAPDPPPIVPEPEPEPKPKSSNWARSTVLAVAMLAFGGAGVFHFYPNLVRRPEPIPVAPESQPAPPPKPPEAPIQPPEPVPAPKTEEPPPVIKVDPKPLRKPEPKKKEIVAPVQRFEAPLAKPTPKAEPLAVVVPDPEPPVRTRLTRPDVNTIVTPPQPVYTGPSSGFINWSGHLEKNGTVAIDGTTAESGTLNGALPGVPVMIEIASKDFGIAEAPSPNNGWRRLVIRSRRKIHSVVTIRWTVVQQ